MLNHPSVFPKANANKIVEIAIWYPLDVQIDRRALNSQFRTADDVDFALPNRQGFQRVVAFRASFQPDALAFVVAGTCMRAALRQKCLCC